MMRLLLLPFLLCVCACEARDVCAESPLCEEGRAINCDPVCSEPGCTNSPRMHVCSAGTTCQVAPGPADSLRFHKSRAQCVVEASDTCEPASSPAPTCDGLGNVQGCSAHRRHIVVPCSQADLFFASAACCLARPDGGAGADAGTPADGGVAADGGEG